MTYVSEGRQTSRLIAGALLLILGVLFALQNLGVVRAGHLGDYWPLVLVWVGLSRMLGPRRRHFASGLVIFLMGVFFQLDRLDVIWVPMRHFWPLLLIAIGFGLIADSFVGRRSGGGADLTPPPATGPGGGS
jgi:lia operon protein LiaF